MPRSTAVTGAQPGPIADADDGDDPDETDEDIDAAIPGWVPDGRPTAGQAWLSAIRADPGRAGGAALATIAVLAVLITVFTLIRQRPEPVVSANLPSVEAVPVPFSASHRPPAHRPVPRPAGQAADGRQCRRSRAAAGTGHGHARCAGGRRGRAAGGTLRGADALRLNLARHLADGEQIVVGVATPAGQRAALGSSVGGPTSSVGGPGIAGQPPPGAPAKTVCARRSQQRLRPRELDALPGWGRSRPRPSSPGARPTDASPASTNSVVDGIGPTRLEKLRPLVRV